MPLCRRARVAGGAGIAAASLLLKLSRLVHVSGDSLTAKVTAYGAGLGAASVPIILLARPDPRYTDLKHLTLVSLLYLATAGAIAGILLTWPIVRKLPDMFGEYRGWVVWLIYGAFFALALPLLTGLLLPVSLVFLNLQLGIIGFLDVPSSLLTSMFRAPLDAFVYGTLGIYTGMFAGALFWIGGFAIDRLSHSRNPVVQKYVPWAIALAVGITTLAFAVLAPVETVAKFG